MNVYLASLVFALLSVSQAYAGTKTATPQAVAKLSASCTISAQNIGFGALSLPVSAQSASSNMTVLCSANAPYTIGLAYGGVYGTTSQTTNGVYGWCSGYTPPLPQACYWTTTTGVTYNYGIMTGAAKGDKLAYSIAVPGAPGKVWNAGNYNYSGTGTGAAQSLSLNATLVPSQSGSSYPTPDSYSDTVTATINF